MNPRELPVLFPFVMSLLGGSENGCANHILFRIRMFNRSQDSLSATFKFFQFITLLVFLWLGLLSGCANPQDREVARQAAARIHSQIHSRDFAAIYDESGEGFKTVEKAEFIAGMTELQNRLGAVKTFKEMAYQAGLDSRLGRTHALVFDVQYEGERVRETLVFVRGDDHKMQLWKLDIKAR